MKVNCHLVKWLSDNTIGLGNVRHISSQSTKSQYFTCENGMQIRVSDHPYKVTRPDVDIVIPLNNESVYMVTTDQSPIPLVFNIKQVKSFILNYYYLYSMADKNMFINLHKIEDVYKDKMASATKKLEKVMNGIKQMENKIAELDIHAAACEDVIKEKLADLHETIDRFNKASDSIENGTIDLNVAALRTPAVFVEMEKSATDILSDLPVSSIIAKYDNNNILSNYYVVNKPECPEDLHGINLKGTNIGSQLGNCFKKASAIYDKLAKCERTFFRELYTDYNYSFGECLIIMQRIYASNDDMKKPLMRGNKPTLEKLKLIYNKQNHGDITPYNYMPAELGVQLSVVNSPLVSDTHAIIEHSDEHIEMGAELGLSHAAPISGNPNALSNCKFIINNGSAPMHVVECIQRYNTGKLKKTDSGKIGAEFKKYMAVYEHLNKDWRKLMKDMLLEYKYTFGECIAIIQEIFCSNDDLIDYQLKNGSDVPTISVARKKYCKDKHADVLPLIVNAA